MRKRRFHCGRIPQEIDCSRMLTCVRKQYHAACIVTPRITSINVLAPAVDHSYRKMSAMCTLILFVLLALFALLVGYARYRTPLLRIPCAHPTSSFSGLWILWKRYQGGGKEIAAVQAAHRRHGTLVRLGPQEVSIASVKDVRRLLQREEKHIWHKAFANFGSVLAYPASSLAKQCQASKLHV